MAAPRIVWKIALAVLTGGLTFVLTNLTKQPPQWSLVLSVLIGGVVLLVQFIVDLEHRQHRVEQRLAALETAHAGIVGSVRVALREEIAKINEATTLFAQLDNAPVAAKSVSRLAGLAARLDHRPGGLAHKVAQAEVDGAVGFLDQLAHRGEITYDGEDRDWLLTLTQHVQHSIDATSRGSVGADGMSFTDEGFWESELSNRYLEQQREAIRRGVRVRRIFILETGDLLANDDFRALCQRQHSIGVQIRTMDVSALAPYRRLNLPDLVVFDGEVAYELTSAPRLGGGVAPYYIRTNLVVQDDAVAERVRLFEDYWELSSDYV